MQIIKIVNGFLKENTYLIGDDKCYIIDPGSFYEGIKKQIDAHFTGVNAILLTHGHFDHIESVDKLFNDYKCPVYMSENDIMQVDGSLKNNPKLNGLLCTLTTKTTDVFALKDPNIIIYETPGHTKGSVCYRFKKENIIFTGDTLFKGEIGRTDLPSGSELDMLKSLKILKNIRENLLVYPGHEEETTLEEEKQHNEYLKII